MSSHVFISYARADDERFVEQLFHDLTERGITVWWDRKAMSSRGRTFLQELRDAIEAADRVVAVVGEHALRSPYVRVEWDHALLFCKGVLPILRQGEDAVMPPEFRLLHWIDFRQPRRYNEALAELLDKLAEPVESLGSLLTPVPSAPPHVQPRRREVEAIAGVVLADVRRPTVVAVDAQTIVLSGMGGVGKSVLAALFARAVDTRRAFFDGVLWLSYGREAEPLSILRTVGAALEDDLRGYVDAHAAAPRISRLLGDRVCLIVADDVWDPRQVAPIHNSLGPRCRLVVTTRDGDLAGALGAHEYRVDVLPDEVALQLLADWSGQPSDSLPVEAGQVAGECGNLPLALAMAGAMVAGRASRWTNVLHKLRSADLAAIRQQFPNYPYPNLLRAIDVSVSGLEDRLRDRFTDLAVFPEDTPVPTTTLGTYWAPLGLDEFDVQDTVDALVARSLAQPYGDDAIKLHDLILDYARHQANDVIALHGRLLDAYQAGAGSAGGSWWDLPDDGYLYDYLFWHLERLGKREELHRVLSAETDDGRPAWWWARERAGQTDGFVADVARAWRLAEDESLASGAAPLVALERQSRYALTQASIATISGSMPLPLLAAALAQGMLSIQAATGHVRQQLNPLDRIAGLLTVAEAASGQARQGLLSEALATAHRVERDRRPDALALVAPHVVEPQAKRAIVADALQVVRETGTEPSGPPLSETEYLRWRWLEALAPILPPELYPIAVDEASRLIQIHDKAVMALIPHAPETVADQLVELAGSLHWGSQRASALAKLFEHLPVTKSMAVTCGPLWYMVGRKFPRLKSALSCALESALEHSRVSTEYAQQLWAVAPHLTADLLAEALHAVLVLDKPLNRAYGIAALAPSLPQDLLEEALRACSDTTDGEARALALAHIVPVLGERQREEQLAATLNAVQAHLDGVFLAAALAQLAPAVSGTHHERALKLARTIEYDEERTEALLCLRQGAGDLDDEISAGLSRAHIGSSMEMAADWLTDHDLVLWRVVLAALEQAARQEVHLLSSDLHLAKFLATMPSAFCADVLDLVSRYHHPPLTRVALTALAPRLPKGLVAKALDLVRIDDLDAQVAALTKLLVGLSPSDRRRFEDDLLSRVRGISDHETRAVALARATQVAADCEPLWQEATAAIKRDQSKAAAEDFLPKVAAWLPEQLHSRAVEFAQGLDDPKARVRALQSIGATASALKAATAANDPELLVDLMADSQDVDPEFIRSAARKQEYRLWNRALRRLAEFVDEPFRSELVKEAYGAWYMGEEPNRPDPELIWNWYTSLPFTLSPDVLEQPLTIARELPDPTRRAKALAELVRRSSAPTDRAIADELIEIAHTSLSEAEAVHTLAMIAAKLQPDLLKETVERAASLADPFDRAAALADMLGALAPPRRDAAAVQALETVGDIPDDQSKEQVLQAVIRVVAPDWLPQLLSGLNSVQDPKTRAHLAADLARRLPDHSRADALAIALRAASVALDKRLIEGLTSMSGSLTSSDARLLLTQILHQLSQQSRAELLEDLPALAPIATRAATEAARDTQLAMIEAVRICTRWWP